MRKSRNYAHASGNLWQLVPNFCSVTRLFSIRPQETRGRSSHVVFGALASLRDLPVDVLLRRFDVAGFAMDAAVPRHVSSCSRRRKRRMGLTFVR